MKPIKLIIKTKSETYPIIIGKGLVLNLSKILEQNSITYNKCLLVIDKNVPKKIITKINQSMKKSENYKFFFCCK